MQVTLIAAAYNSAGILPRFFAALAAQTCQDFELVFVDDGSTDDTFEAAQGLGQVFGARMHLVRNARNLGLSATRNVGLEYAASHPNAYISFLDVDDLFDEHYLQDLLSTALDTRAGLTIGGIRRIDGASGRVLATEMVHAPQAFYPEAARCFELAFVNPCSYAKLFRFDRIRAVRYRDIARSEDTCYLFEALPLLGSVAFTGEVHYSYRVHGASLTSAFDAAVHDSMHRVFARVLPTFDSGGHAAFRDMFETQVFIHSSIGGVLRRAQAGAKAREVASAELRWLDAAMPSWRTNPYLSVGGYASSAKHRGPALCAALYKMGAASLFVVGYNLLARLAGKEVRI